MSHLLNQQTKYKDNTMDLVRIKLGSKVSRMKNVKIRQSMVKHRTFKHPSQGKKKNYTQNLDLAN